MPDKHTSNGPSFTRRSMLQATGALAGAGLLGVGSGSVAAEHGFDTEFANTRVREAAKVWARGYRGQQDRPIGLTDTGIDARHPDLGPWNGIRATIGAAGPLVQQDGLSHLDGTRDHFEDTIGPGANGNTTVSHEIVAPAAADRIEASLAWPATDAVGATPDLGLELHDADGNVVDTHDGILSNPQALGTDEIEGGKTYFLVVKTEANAENVEYELDARYYEYPDEGSVLAVEKQTYREPDDISGTIGPGAPGTSSNRHPFTFDPPADEELPNPDPDFFAVDATLSWTPEQNDIELFLEDPDGNRIASSTNPSEPEHIEVQLGEPGTYTWVVETWANTVSDYTISFELQTGEFEQVEQPGPTVFADDETGEVIDNAVWDHTDPEDKVVGWYDAGSRYGEYAKPRDPDGHGTHVSSIMAGTGAASTVDEVRTERPQAVLTAGDTVQYELDAVAGTGVFASAYGDAIDLLVEGPDGRTLGESRLFGTDASTVDNNLVETPTVHDSGTATYTVIVRAAEGELASTGRVDRIAVGTFADPATTDGDRSGSGVSTLHAGLAPGAGLVGLQGLSDPTADVGRHAEFFAEHFNLRSVNMSWGNLGGAPLGAFGGQLSAATVTAVRRMADAGILTVAAAGNSFTPANGNSEPAVAEEAISVVSTGPLDGISSFSSGGTGGVDEDEDEFDGKPDVTAPGGRAPAYPASIATGGPYDLVKAARAEDPDTPESELTVRGYTGKAGTSMASPYVNGVAGLVAEAMDAEYGDAPSTIELPDPSDTSREDVLRLKQVVLATASETAFTAAPYHSGQTIPHQPTYDFGDRDPYEGYGRVNPDAAVDAVTRRLSETVSESVGLDVPEHSRAVAGYVGGDADDAGVYEASVDFSHYSGGNEGMTKGDPHVDLFVYDAENPAENGEPTRVARAQGRQGSASIQFTASQETDDGTESGTYYVVAKLVNVPGAVNGYDVEAHLDLTVEQVEDLIATGTRTDDGSAFTGGQTDKVDITIDASDPVLLRDTVPSEWTVLTEHSDDVARVEDTGSTKVVYFDVVPATSQDVTYFVEAPSGPQASGSYTFGPVEVTNDTNAADPDWVAVSGTSDTNGVVGVGT